MRFVVAVGMHGATPDEWNDYRRMFQRSVRHINYGLVAGYDGQCACVGERYACTDTRFNVQCDTPIVGSWLDRMVSVRVWERCACVCGRVVCVAERCACV